MYLRENDSTNVLALLHRMLWIFLGFESTQYTQCLAYTLLQHEYFKANGHPAYIQMLHNVRPHNEERSEMSLSILAFSVAGDSDRSNVDKLDMNYSLMNKCRTIIKDINKDLNIHAPSRFEDNSIDTEREVNMITQHMRDLIKSMRDGTWTTYYPNQQKYKMDSAQHSSSTLRYLTRNTTTIMRRTLEQVRVLLLDTNNSYSEYFHLIHPPTGPRELSDISDSDSDSDI